MAVFPNSARAPKFPTFLICGRSRDFPASQAERLDMYQFAAERKVVRHG